MDELIPPPPKIKSTYIVNKIINEHKGELAIFNNNPGVKIIITLPKID